MTDLKAAKELVLQYFQALDKAVPEETANIEASFAAADYKWFGYHPFGEIADPAIVGTQFWTPLKAAIRPLQRRQDIFFAGHNALIEDGAVWVVSMGHLMGLFDDPWLGIRPTKKIVMLRYCAFHEVRNGKISRVMMYFDLPHLMMQAGQNPFLEQTAAHLVQPGPMAHDGLLYDCVKPQEGQKTLDAINAMISDLGQWQSGLPLEDELARTWHQDMLWWGPHGIGSSYTIERYARQHSGPFRAAFSERSQTRHICRVAEGHFGGFVGWPNFTARLTGSFMGHAPTGDIGDFRVIDLYRREGGKLAENWILIDLLHFWKMQGRDFLNETTGYIHET